MAVTHYDKPQWRSSTACGQRGAVRLTKDAERVTCKRCLTVLGVTVVREQEKVTPTVVREKLVAMFAEVEPDFRAEARARYKRQAEAEHRTWIERLTTSKDGQYKDRLGYKNTYRPGQYVRYNPKDKYDHGPQGYGSYGWKVKQAVKDRYVPDYVRAQREADRDVDSAKATFLHRQGKKIAAALEGRDDLKEAVGMLRLEGTVTGGITVRMENGDQFTLNTQIIINCRLNPQYVSFYQFPSRFSNIVKDGVRTTMRSVAWMKENF